MERRTRKWLDSAIGLVGCLGIIAGGVMILVWGFNCLKQVHESGEWPRVDGRIVRSTTELKGRVSELQIEYDYVVNGVSHSSDKVSLAPFGPGGFGRVYTKLARYPVGKRVVVYYDPSEPEIAILEPQLYSPFFMPMFFGVIFVLMGAGVFGKAIRQLTTHQTPQRRGISTSRLAITTGFISLILYAMFQIIAFDSEVREVHIIAFGEHPAGIPNIVFVLLAQTVLFVPVPWVFWHAAKLMHRAAADGQVAQLHGRWARFRYLATAYEYHADLRKSVGICVFGFLYGIAVGMAWILYAAIYVDL